MQNYESEINVGSNRPKSLAGQQRQTHVDCLLGARSSVVSVRNQLNRLISDVRGPQPEAGTAQCEDSKPSLLQALEQTPHAIREECENIAKMIESLREMLRL